MAEIIENLKGRKSIMLNTDDVISIVREYQNLTYSCNSYEEIREKINNFSFLIPED